MRKDINDLTYGMVYEVSEELPLDYGMTDDSIVLESNDDLAYGMTVEELINTEEFQELFEDFTAFLSESIKRLKDR